MKILIAGASGLVGSALIPKLEAGGDEIIRLVRKSPSAGVRVVNLRFGPILSDKGGMLGKMLTPFKLGLAGKIGTGKQFISWIAIDDVIGAVTLALKNNSLRGPLNVVSPNPVTNEAFT